MLPGWESERVEGCGLRKPNEADGIAVGLSIFTLYPLPSTHNPIHAV
jgi:hypothetical protein